MSSIVQLDKKKIYIEIAVVAFYLFTVLAICLPMLFSPSNTMIGGDFLYPTLWTYEFAISNIYLNHEVPVWTNDLNFPDGGSLGIIGWSFILIVLAGKLLGLSNLLGLNIALVLHLFIGFYFAYRLSLHISGRKMESIVGGFAYGLSPYVISLLFNGQVEKLSHGFLPLIVLLVLNLRSRHWFLPATALGLVLALLVSTSFYNAIFGIMLAVIIGAGQLVRQKNNRRTYLFFKLAMAAALTVLLAIPYLAYWHESNSVKDTESLFVPALSPQLPYNSVNTSQLNNASLAGWFLPFDSQIHVDAKQPLPVVHVHYLGWICILLCAFAFIKKRVRGEPLESQTDKSEPEKQLSPPMLLGTAGIFMLVASGYYLRPDYNTATFFGVYLELPLYWIYKLFPQVGTFTVPYRAVIGVSLCLSMLLTMGLCRVCDILGSKRRLFICALVGVGILLEILFVSQKLLPLPARNLTSPQVYKDLAKIDDCGAVLDVPNESHGLHSSANSSYVFFQTIHGHPLTIHLNYGPLHQVNRTSFYENFNIVLSGNDNLQKDFPRWEKVNFKYLVLHEKLINPARLHLVLDFLDNSFELIKAYPEEKIRLYRSSLPSTNANETNINDSRFYLDPGVAQNCQKS